MYKINNQNINAFFGALSKEFALFLPVHKDEMTDFCEWNPNEAPENFDFETLKTAKSPKEFFLPPFEELYSAKNTADGIDLNPMSAPDAPFILFGVRACDLEGIGILDQVYLSDPTDRFYEARRNAATIFTLACESPTPTCFCNSFGIDPAHPKGDVSVWQTEGFFYLAANNAKGEKALGTANDLLENVNTKPIFTHKPNPPLPVNHLNPEKLLKTFDSNKWDELHRTCISCGTCTFLCPTCQCYDISGSDSDGVIRCHRTWDSCMYKDFTQMAHGNPRPSAKARFRQRFMHKLLYHQENHQGSFGCVGCGRCTNKCPVNLSVVKVIKALGARENA